MAQATNYFPSQDVSVWIQDEAIVGTEPDDAALTRLQATSFTIPEASVPLEFSSARGTKLWTFDTALRGTPTSVLLATEAVFEDSSSEAVLNNTYVFPHAGYQDGATSSPGTFDVRFVNAGADSATETIECAGCVGTGFTLSEDIGSEGGELLCNINWATAYYPEHSGQDITASATDSAAPKNIRELTPASCLIDADNEMVIQSWELNVNRTIERVHYKDTTSGTFKPFGYAMTGGMEVTGSMTVIRNDDVHDILASFRNSTTVDINIAGTNFAIAMDKCLLGESTIDNGGAVLTQTIPFTVVGADDLSSDTKMLGITIS